MFTFGRMYDVEIPSFTRSLEADEVICRISAPSDAVIFVLEAWFGQVGTDNLNEANAIEMVRLSTDGVGGATALFEAREPGDAAFGGTGATIDASDWSTEPTVSDVLGGATPFNLATGWNWTYASAGPIVLSPNRSNRVSNC